MTWDEPGGAFHPASAPDYIPQPRMRELQLSRLRAVVRRAYDNVLLFRQRLNERGFAPPDLRQLEDIAHLPFTTKADLRDTYPFGLFASPMSEVVRLHASSGTTGKPIVVAYTQQDLEVWTSVMVRAFAACGLTHGDVVQNAYGYGLFTGGLGAHYGAEALGCTVIPMSGGQTEKQVRLIADLEPDAIMVTPSYALAIADEFARQGLDARRTSLRVGIHGAEPWTESMRREIEERFAMDAVDIYGLSEVMGPGVASECVETKDGLHVWEDHFYPEIINPDTGAVLPDGTTGELVFTTLTKEALPLIRYRTRDLTTLLPGTARTMRRMARISGRSDDMLIVRGVNVFPTQIEEILLGDVRLSAHYVLELRREGRLDDLTVVSEVKPNAMATEADLQIAADAVARRIKDLVGVTATVRLVDPGSVERSLGKAKRVVDFRQ